LSVEKDIYNALTEQLRDKLAQALLQRDAREGPDCLWVQLETSNILFITSSRDMKPKEMTSLPEMQMEEERQAMTNKE
jgi:hypothetical protein